MPASKATSKKRVSAKAPTKSTKATAFKAKATKASVKKPTQFAASTKPNGKADIRAYITILPPWQVVVAKRIEKIVAKVVPNSNRAVRWGSPMYGVEGNGWFLAFRGFKRHIKISFFKGASLKPVPPVGKFRDVRSVDFREEDTFDEKQWTSWIKQASSQPGWDGGSPRNYGGETL